MVVGTGRFELPTCRLGGGRSIHLSYVPDWFSGIIRFTDRHTCIKTVSQLSSVGERDHRPASR